MLKSRPVLWALPAVTVVLAAGAWAVRGVTSPQKEATPETPAVTAVALVRQDLTESISLTGKLGYGTARPVKGGRAGVVTWLPAAGAVISRGKALYRIDDKPVPLFYGSLPLFRTLAQPNTVGRDVRVVRDNLKALGYPVGRQYAAGERVRQVTPSPAPQSGASPGPSPGPSAPAEVWTKVRTGEDVYTSALMNAVKRWQDDAGLPVTGAVGAGDVAVLTGPVRVDAVSALAGDPAESPLMSVTPTAKAVTVQAEVSEAGSIHRGDKADVRLPDERTVPGKVAAVATTVQADGADPAAGPPTVTVTITLDEPALADRLDAAPVQVDLPRKTREDVLVAPVGALLALAEGGYAVQIEGGPMVPVRTGMFAGGMVEVSGDGLTDGVRVVTTS